MPVYHGLSSPTKTSFQPPVQLNRRWIALIVFVVLALLLSSAHLLSLQYENLPQTDSFRVKASVAAQKQLPPTPSPWSPLIDDTKPASSPSVLPVKESLLPVKASPIKSIVVSSSDLKPSPPPAEIKKYKGPPLTIDQVQKKIAKALYGPIVAHETEDEKKQNIPITHLFQEIYKHGNEILHQTWKEGDYEVAGRHLRTFSQLYAILFDHPELHSQLQHLPEFVRAGYLTMQLERKFFPWLSKKYSSLFELRNSWKGRGIVMTSGKWHFPLALHAILSLRTVINATLPVEIFYSGGGDIDTYMVDLYRRIPDVNVIDVSEYFEHEKSGIHGWHVKPFAMLASSFEEIIFLDADVLFLQDPAITFDFKGYKDTGAVFFFDRSIGHGKWDTHEWFESWLKDPTEVARGARFWNHNTIHEMESGVVAINKKTAYMQLLGVCWMNTKQDREIAMKHVHGDKETFWMIAELIRLPYYFVPSYGGTVGYKNQTDGYICGGLYHADDKDKPFWWNGGVLKNKHFHRDEYITFTHYAFDHTTDVDWKWETEHTPFCLMPKNPKTEIGELSLSERAAAARMVEIYKLIQEVGSVKNNWDAVMKSFHL